MSKHFADGYQIPRHEHKRDQLLARFTNQVHHYIQVGRGPLWLTYDTSTRIANSDEEAKWVWSVFVIEARE